VNLVLRVARPLSGCEAPGTRFQKNCTVLLTRKPIRLLKIGVSKRWHETCIRLLTSEVFIVTFEESYQIFHVMFSPQGETGLSGPAGQKGNTGSKGEKVLRNVNCINPKNMILFSVACNLGGDFTTLSK